MVGKETFRSQEINRRGNGERSDSNPTPIILVNDFNDALSTEECVTSVAKVFDNNGVENPLRVANETVTRVGNIKQFNITDGAFTISQHAGNIKGIETIYAGVVDPGVGTERRAVAVRTEHHEFIGPDNGLFSPALEQERIREAYVVEKEAFKSVTDTFHGRDIFAPLAAERSLGIPFKEIHGLESIEPETLVKRPFKIGEVVHVDGTGNVKIYKDGIPHDEQGKKATQLKVILPKLIFDGGWLPRRSLTVPVGRTFEEVKEGGLLAIEGSSGRNGNGGKGFVEVVVNKGNAGARLGVEPGDVVGLDWKFPKKEPSIKQRITTVFKGMSS